MTDLWEVIRSLGVKKFAINDKLCAEGDKRCGILDKQLCVPEDHLIPESDDLRCDEFGCRASFSSLTELEIHYRARHSHVCSSCAFIFPSFHLLDRHVVENHDSFFHVASRRKPMYACLLEFCKESFMAAAERKRHCISVHKFPLDFRYDTQWKNTGDQFYKYKPDKHKKFQTRWNKPKSNQFFTKNSQNVPDSMQFDTKKSDQYKNDNSTEMECCEIQKNVSTKNKNDNKYFQSLNLITSDKNSLQSNTPADENALKSRALTNETFSKYLSRKPLIWNCSIPEKVAFGYGVQRAFPNYNLPWHKKGIRKVQERQISMTDVSEVLDEITN